MMKKTVLFLSIVVVLAGVAIYIAYSKLQQHQEKQQQYTQELIQDQKQAIDAQRLKLSHVPDQLPVQVPKAPEKHPILTRPAPAQRPLPSPLGYFKCDGRQYCAQMHSLAEARWFVRNCPNTKMDGNNDGEPCEKDSRRQSDPNWQ